VDAAQALPFFASQADDQAGATSTRASALWVPQNNALDNLFEEPLV